MFLKNGIVAAVSSSHVDVRQSIGLPSNPPVLIKRSSATCCHGGRTVDKTLIGPLAGKLLLIVKLSQKPLLAL